MRRFFFCLSLLLILASFGLSQEQNFPEDPSKSYPLPGDGSWAHEDGLNRGTIKEALLIGVGRHASSTALDMAWDIPCVDNDIDTMKDVLENTAGFKTFKVLKDSLATISNIKGYLTTDLPSRVQKGDNLLLIYLSGHGVVQDRQRCWFTHYTDVKGGGYDPLLTSTMLSEWIGALKSKAASKGAAIKVCLVMDSCATEEKGPHTRPRNMEMGDELIFATSPGEMASSSAFTKSFAKALSELGKNERIHLREIYELTRKTLSDKGMSLPERYPEKRESILLLDNQGLSFFIRAHDELLPAMEVKDASVFHDGKELGITPCLISGLKPGDYPLIIRKQGYLNSRAMVKLQLRRSGRVYEVPLLPAYNVLEGTVSREGGGAIPKGVNVHLLGESISFRDGLHQRAAKVGADGRFKLLTPPDAEIEGILARGLGSPHQENLYLGSLKPWYINLANQNRVPVYSLNPIMVSGSARLAESEMKMDRTCRTIFEEALSRARSKKVNDIALAAEELMMIESMVNDEKTCTEIKSRVREITTRAFRIYMANRRYGEGADLAEKALNVFPGDGAFSDWKSRFEREDIPASLRDSFEAAGKAVDDGDLVKAEALYAGLMKEESKLTAYYMERVFGNLSAVRGDLFIESYCRMSTCDRQGDMQGAVEAYVVADRIAPDDKKGFMKIWERRMLPFLDDEAPVLVLESLSRGRASTDEPYFTLRGRVSDNRMVNKVTVNGKEVPLSGTDVEKTFSVRVKLDEGDNSFVVKAIDWRGFEDRETATLTYAKHPVVSGFTHLKKESFSCGGQTHTVEIYRHDRTGLEFVLVPGGSFEMGSNSGDSDEKPVHRVNVKDFLICRTEVTQGIWEKIMGESPWSGEKYVREGQDYAAAYISWDDCDSFCDKTGLRMPTEAEWEYACRAGTSTKYCFGSSDSGLGNYAWYDDNADEVGEEYAHRVARKKANAFGLFDMHGNVWEWCSDKWHDNYNGAPTDGSSWESSGSSLRVFRGGGWHNNSGHCRSALRNRLDPRMRLYNPGFRPALSYSH